VTTDAGGGTVTNTYNLNDVLTTTGPVASGENAKQRSLEYNGGGQITSVCEITAGTSSAPGSACGQNTTHIGYLTKYSYDGGRLIGVKQNAQGASGNVQSRTLAYDLLGRKLSESIPETGNSYFTYDSDTSGVCSGSYPGDLVKTVDNMGNVACFTYDGLHRPLSSQVVSGTYAGVTPNTYLVYDGASLNGTAMSNAMGSLAEAYTCTGSCATKLTDIFYSIIPNGSGGAIAQMWESTPNSGGYFLTQTTSYANGAPAGISASKSGASIGVPSVSFGIDGEGRLSSAVDKTHNLNLVGSASYNPAGSPTAVLFGNGDSDGFLYDPNTNRPTQFQYSVLADISVSPNVGAFTQTGNLNWNSNGSLNSFSFVDNNDTTKNQTCTYGMDDLNRLASVGCGSAWAQNFSYDAFGNIQKSGSSSYGAGYNAMTNQAVSGVTAAYDANGNQTASTNALLIWNAAAQPVTVQPAANGMATGNAVNGTYDAMGRLVETGTGGTFTYDSGTLTAVIGGCTASVGYSQGATSSWLAQQLANNINTNCSSAVFASNNNNGSIVTINSTNAGTAYDYSLSTSSNYNNALFTTPSFSITPSGSAMTTTTGTYDSGVFQATIGTGSTACTGTATYSGATSTSGLATSLANSINSKCSNLVTASSNGATINLTSKAYGTASDYALSAQGSNNTALFSSPSFTLTPSGSTMTTPAATIYDGGMWSVAVYANGTAICGGGTGYGRGSTATAIATSLAASMASCSSYLNAVLSSNSSSNAMVTLTAKNLGATADYTVVFTFQSESGGAFSTPSFTLTTSGSGLSGGSSTTYASETISFSGTEQTTTPPGTGSFTFAGTQQTLPGDGTATLTITGSDQLRLTTATISQYTQFVFTPGGSKLAVVQNGALSKATIPLPGGGSAIYNANGLEFLRHKDWLGSSRLATTWTHGVYSKEAYAPFGETYNEAGTPDRSFTGQDQDTSSGVYDFLFRKYDPTAGRWLSPDPAGWGAASASNPQSLNRYAYVLNNPNSLIDPNGLECVWDDGSYDSADDPSTGTADGCASQGGTYIDPSLFESVEGNQYGSWSGDKSDQVAFDWLTPSVTSNAMLDNSDGGSGGGSYGFSFVTNYNGGSMFSTSSYMVGLTQTAPNKPPPSKNCGGILAKGAVQTGLDALGVIPGEGLVAGTIGKAALVGTQTMAGFGSAAISIASNDQAGIGFSAVGMPVSLTGVALDGMKGAAELIPVAGQWVAGAATLWDIGSTIHEYGGCKGWWQ